MGSSKIEFSGDFLWKLVVNETPVQIFKVKTKPNVTLETQEMAILDF
jgi:hypothetical protein